eukprot:1148058-Pelagomonas_calceolata.AAC.2
MSLVVISREKRVTVCNETKTLSKEVYTTNGICTWVELQHEQPSDLPELHQQPWKGDTAMHPSNALLKNAIKTTGTNEERKTLI